MSKKSRNFSFFAVVAGKVSHFVMLYLYLILKTRKFAKIAVFQLFVQKRRKKIFGLKITPLPGNFSGDAMLSSLSAVGRAESYVPCTRNRTVSDPDTYLKIDTRYTVFCTFCLKNG